MADNRDPGVALGLYRQRNAPVRMTCRDCQLSRAAAKSTSSKAALKRSRGESAKANAVSAMATSAAASGLRNESAV